MELNSNHRLDRQLAIHTINPLLMGNSAKTTRENVIKISVVYSNKITFEIDAAINDNSSSQ